MALCRSVLWGRVVDRDRPSDRVGAGGDDGSGSEVAVESGCARRTANAAVIAYGTALVDDPARIGPTDAVELDEMWMLRKGPWHTQGG